MKKGQFAGSYQAKDAQLARYLEKARRAAQKFHEFQLLHIPREHNSLANLLSKLASTVKSGVTRLVIQETIRIPSVDQAEEVMELELDQTWLGPIKAYLLRGDQPQDPVEAKKVVRDATHYTMVGQHLYEEVSAHLSSDASPRRRGSGFWMRCTEEVVAVTLGEELLRTKCCERDSIGRHLEVIA